MTPEEESPKQDRRSESMKKLRSDPEFQRRLNEALRSPESRAKKSAARSEINRLNWQNPEYRAQQSEARRRNWDDPEYRRRSSRSGKNKGASNPAFKHGAAGREQRSAEYTAFCAAKGRCTNPNSKKWKDYGGRGIQFKFDSFEEFLAEVGPRPSTEHSLDRFPDNNGNYEKGNVRWATRTEQTQNRRPSEEWVYSCQSCGTILVCPHCAIVVPHDGIHADA